MSFGAWRLCLCQPDVPSFSSFIAYDESIAARITGHNFSVLFPVWDLLFGTAKFNTGYVPTGAHDQQAAEGTRIMAELRSQQVLGIRLMLRTRRLTNLKIKMDRMATHPRIR